MNAEMINYLNNAQSASKPFQILDSTLFSHPKYAINKFSQHFLSPRTENKFRMSNISVRKKSYLLSTALVYFIVLSEIIIENFSWKNVSFPGLDLE
jgi:hypothetical protein